MQQQVYYNIQDEFDEELNINFKKILLTVWNKRFLIIKVFTCVLAFFIILTFVLPKKYKVSADLYINKANSTNLSEFNPFILDEAGSGIVNMGADKSMNNELELMQSPLVIDKVIRENNIVIKKKWGIIPNRKEGEFVSTKGFLKKNISFENKKNTNVITITYKSKNNETAYNVVNSIINNYIDLHKQLLTEKSKSDIEILEQEYNKLKKDLNSKISRSSGIPANALSGSGNLAAMSAFSASAQKALSNIQGQYIAGEKSRIDIQEDAQKVASISSRLERARLIADISDSSKVIVLEEPQKLRDFENSSPKLLINLILGIVFGGIFALIALIHSEITDERLTYSKLGDNIIYNFKRDFIDLQTYLLTNENKNITAVIFDELSNDTLEKLSNNNKIHLVRAEISSNFIDSIKNADDVLLISQINKTDSKLYTRIKGIVIDMNKNIARDILI